MTRRPRASTPGFTLVEVIVALAVSGLVVLLAQRVFAAAGEAGRALEASRIALDREANARRWLAAAFLSLDVGDSAGSFEGRPDRMAFAAWLETQGAWFARSRIELGETDGRFLATLGAGQRITLPDSVERLDFDYLLEPGADTKWVREWISPVSAPLAVRIRIQRHGGVDTLLLLIKERG